MTVALLAVTFVVLTPLATDRLVQVRRFVVTEVAVTPASVEMPETFKGPSQLVVFNVLDPYTVRSPRRPLSA